MISRTVILWSTVIIAISLSIMISIEIFCDREEKKKLWVEIVGWPIEKFEVNNSERNDDSPTKRLTIKIVNISDEMVQCFLQVDGNGIGAGIAAGDMYSKYASPLIELGGIHSGVNKKSVNLVVGPAEEEINCVQCYTSVFYLDVKIVDYQKRTILFRRLCPYFFASVGDENLHLDRPREGHPADDDRYKHCECIPKPIGYKRFHIGERDKKWPVVK